MSAIVSSPQPVLGSFTPDRISRLRQIGIAILRYGMVGLLLFWGGFKFFTFEAEAIQPLVAESPFLSWLYPLFGVRGTSALIGVIEIIAALLICARAWRPDLSALGSLIAAGAFLVTLSFLVTTPGALSLSSPLTGFLLKDIMLLGAALYTASEALAAHQREMA
jgi:uncharacterized membrane protein YkgB